MHSIEFFSLELLREKVWNILENSGNLVCQKCGHPGAVAVTGCIFDPSFSFPFFDAIYCFIFSLSMIFAKKP